MARKTQNHSTAASRRSSRLMGQAGPEEIVAGPSPVEGANHRLLTQLVQQVQDLTTAVQNLQQPMDRHPPQEGPAPPSRHSRRSQPGSRHSLPRSSRHQGPGRRVSHHRSGQQSPESRPERHRRKRPRSPSYYQEEASTSGSSQPVESHRLKEKLRNLDQQVAELKKDARRPTEGLRIRTHPPFVRRITEEPIPTRFKMPQMELYDGTTDPCDHLERYRTLMMIQGATDALMCLAFPATLQKSAWAWYLGLEPESVRSFEQLEEQFVAHFSTSRRRPRHSDSLFSVIQGEKESLKDFVARFNAATLEVSDLNESVAMSAMKKGLRQSRFTYSLDKTFPRTYSELLARADKYIRADEGAAARRETEKKKPQGSIQQPLG